MIIYFVVTAVLTFFIVFIRSLNEQCNKELEEESRAKDRQLTLEMMKNGYEQKVIESGDYSSKVIWVKTNSLALEDKIKYYENKETEVYFG